MSRPAKPAVVGAFVLAALVLALATLIYVGSVQLFSREETLVLYFDESVNGLVVGAPVKFRGVPIGEVTDIRIRYNQPPTSTAIPVLIKIDLERLSGQLAGSDALAGGAGYNAFDLSNEEHFVLALRKGLRGRLQLDSFLTGLLFVEIDYFATDDQNYADELVQEELVFKEIPTVPSIFSEFGSTTADIFTKLSAIDIETLNRESVLLLRSLNQAVADLQVAELSTSIRSAARQVETALSSDQINSLIDNLNRTSSNLDSLVARLEGSVDPVVGSYLETMKELQVTLQAVQEAVSGLDAETASLGTQIQLSLRDFQEAARAAEEFFRLLEQNPRALISGRAIEQP